jgi:hydrogenase maturation factor
LQNAAEGVVVDITLKGAKPAAKVLGLTIPQSLLARSDEWIR